MRNDPWGIQMIAGDHKNDPWGIQKRKIMAEEMRNVANNFLGY